jgi:nitrile hydratase subunit beta
VNGVHDLGGLDGLGAIDPPAEEPVFHSEWEKRVFAMFIPFVLAGLNLDQFRHGIERLHPVEYLSGRYYEHWLHTVEDGLVAKGLIDERELEERTRHYLENPDAPLPDRGDPEQAEQFIQLYGSGASTRRESDKQPAFKAGDRVRVRNINPTGHTRSARYVRGKEGVVERVYDAFVFPDTNAKEQGEDPQTVYNVRFDAAEVWGTVQDGARHTIHFDLWEPYLEAV